VTTKRSYNAPTASLNSHFEPPRSHCSKPENKTSKGEKEMVGKVVLNHKKIELNSFSLKKKNKKKKLFAVAIQGTINKYHYLHKITFLLTNIS
jgi:hypothetical protein